LKRAKSGNIHLARAGVLEDHRYTTPEKIQAPFPSHTYVKRTIVRDRHVVTAVAGAFVDFAIEICDWFHLFKSSQEKAMVSNYYKGMG
jgi:transcriptional regulator GlxA family with amidase domain